MSEVDALRTIKTVARALRAVHEKNLLHRDVKPANIILANDGRVVLIDFGTVREFSQHATRAMTSMVTPGYAPLEQRGTRARFGPYTDVYSLGATLYHMLTGQIPVDALDRSLGVNLRNPSQVSARVTKPIGDAVMRAMSLKAEDRPQNVSEFVRMLERRETDAALASMHGIAQPTQSNPGAAAAAQPLQHQIVSSTPMANRSDSLAAVVGVQAQFARAATPRLQAALGGADIEAELEAPEFQQSAPDRAAGFLGPMTFVLGLVIVVLIVGGVFAIFHVIGLSNAELQAQQNGESTADARARSNEDFSDGRNKPRLRATKAAPPSAPPKLTGKEEELGKFSFEVLAEANGVTLVVNDIAVKNQTVPLPQEARPVSDVPPLDHLARLGPVSVKYTLIASRGGCKVEFSFSEPGGKTYQDATWSHTPGDTHDLVILEPGDTVPGGTKRHGKHGLRLAIEPRGLCAVNGYKLVHYTDMEWDSELERDVPVDRTRVDNVPCYLSAAQITLYRY